MLNIPSKQHSSTKKILFSSVKIGQQVSNMAVRISICIVELTVCQKKSPMLPLGSKDLYFSIYFEHFRGLEIVIFCH